MKTKEEILIDIYEGLKSGIISQADLKAFIDQPSPAQAATEVDKKSDKLGAVDVMFYIAGIVLFAAIISLIVQSWTDGSALVHISLSAGVGALLWAIARYLIKQSEQSDIRRGIINSSLLTGSLSIIVGGYIITNELIGGFSELNLLPGAITLAVLGGLHLGFDRIIKKNLILLMGVFLSVAAVPTVLFRFLEEAKAGSELWFVVIILSSGLLAYATRVVARLNPDRHKISSAFDSLAAFLALMSLYVLTFVSDYSAFWFVLLVVAVFAIFYLSIIAQNKHLLGSGSFFLVLSVITVSFKYFSGFGITTSLILATTGLLGSAALASSINKKYFKQPQQH